KYAGTHLNLGNALTGKGQLNEAIESYNKAIALDRKYAAPHIGLGFVWAGKGRWDKAIPCYRKAVQLDPKAGGAHYNLGVLLCDFKRDYDGAIASFQEATAVNPKGTNAQVALGKVLLRQGRYAEAKDASSRALALLPPTHPLRPRVAEQVQACE